MIMAPQASVGALGQRREWMPAYAITLQVFTTTLLGVRLISRFKKLGGGLGLDDMFVVLGWLFSISLTVSVLYMTINLEFDRHIFEIPTNLWTHGSVWGWITEILVLLAGLCVKLSVLLFYRRLVDGTASRKFKFAIWAAMAFVTAYTIVFIILLLVGCQPFIANLLQYDVLWRGEHPEARCWSTNVAFSLATLCGVFSVFTDWYSVMLPAVLLLQIRMNARQKYGLMFIFGLGYTVVGAGIARTYYLGKVQVELDKFWYAFDVEAASIAEINVAIICACAPSLKHVTGLYFKNMKTWGSSRGSKSRTNDGSNQNMPRKRPAKSSWLTGSDTDVQRSTSTGSFLSNKFSSKFKYNSSGGKNGFGHELSSFAEAHELGVDGFAPVAEGYEEKQRITMFESPSTPNQLQSIDENDESSSDIEIFPPASSSHRMC